MKEINPVTLFDVGYNVCHTQRKLYTEVDEVTWQGYGTKGSEQFSSFLYALQKVRFSSNFNFIVISLSVLKQFR